MLIRITLVGLLAIASGLYAQPRGRGGPGGGGRFLGAAPGMPGRTVRNAPYSAEMITETSQALADGNRIRQSSSSKFYRDSEGRTRREQSLTGLNGLAPSSNLPQVVFIDDPVAGVSYALNQSGKTASKSVRRRPMAGAERRGGSGARGSRFGQPGSDREPAPRRSGSSNVKTEALGRQLIEGVPADGTRTTMTIPAGQIGNDQPINVVSETWYSPELQTVVLSKRSDPRSGETVFRLTNISRAEPPRTLFDVPADYRITESPRGARGSIR